MIAIRMNRAMVMLVASLAVGPVLAGSASGNAATVGDLLQGTARLRGIDAADGALAAAALREAGFDVPATDLDKVLTQGDVVRIARSLGLNVTSSTPETIFDDDDLGNFFSAFSGALSRGDSAGGAGTHSDSPDDKDEGPADPNPPSGVDPLSKGKGKKKGIMKSPANPER